MKASQSNGCLHIGERVDARWPSRTPVDAAATQRGSPAKGRTTRGLSHATLRLAIGLEDAAGLNQAPG